MATKFSFRPRLLDCLRGYDRGRFLADLNAGFVVGVIALSLCTGLGIASGATPQAGLYAGIVGGFLVSALGGSRVQVGGPAGAFVGLVAVTAATHGFGGLMVCTVMAGGMLFLMGAARMGTLIKFIPHPLTMGFTCGIAVVIIATQVRELLGLQMVTDSPHIPEKAVAIFRALGTVDWKTALLAAVSLAVLAMWPGSWQRRVPASIFVVALGTVAAGVFGLDVATIGSRFGGIPQGLPEFALPQMDWSKIGSLVGPAFAIAVLCGVESLLSAVVADGMIDERHDSNQELMAQGVANMVTPLFGGIPVTGVIARTATNIRSGGSTPVAGMVHAGVLLLFVLVAAPIAQHIPLASLGAVLTLVAIRMGDWHEFACLRRYPPGDALVFLVAFALTVLIDLTWAVYVGMLLSAFLFIKRVSETTQVDHVGGGEASADDASSAVARPAVPAGVVVYRVFGSLLFGAAEKLDYVLRRVGRDTKVVVLDMATVTAMDATALNRLESLLRRLRRNERVLVLSGPHTQPYALMELSGFFDELGRDNIAGDLGAAATRAVELTNAKASGGTTA
jgi:SulP family sulfate permease